MFCEPIKRRPISYEEKLRTVSILHRKYGKSITFLSTLFNVKPETIVRYLRETSTNG